MDRYMKLSAKMSQIYLISQLDERAILANCGSTYSYCKYMERRDQTGVKPAKEFPSENDKMYCQVRNGPDTYSHKIRIF
jgi:hypothetical protein